MTQLTVVGPGQIGGGLAAGLVAGGWPPGDLVLCGRRPGPAQELADRLGASAAPLVRAVAGADVVVLAAKPQDTGALLADLAGHLRPGALVVAVAGGLTTDYYERRLPAGTPVVRAIPNVAVLVRESMTALSGGAHARPEHLATARDLFERVGRVLEVVEADQDAVNTMAGVGPAYFCYLVDALTQAGVLTGLAAPQARSLLVQAMRGAAVLLQETGRHPAEVRDAVTSKGGVTIHALRVLDDHGVRPAVYAAVEAGRRRAATLAAETEAAR